MKKLPCFIFILFLLVLMSTAALAATPNIIDQNSNDPQIQLLIKQLKEVRKEKRLLLDSFVEKHSKIKVSVEGKDKETLKKIEVYDQQISTINKSMNELKAKKKSTWKQLKEAREKKDAAKVNQSLGTLISMEKQAIELINKKISLSENMLKVIE